VKRTLLAGFLTLVSVSAVRADNWPQWRGPTNDGVCKETNHTAEWSDTKNVVWKLAMPGMGSSTPAIWEDRMFLTSEDDKDLELLCISTAGKELWKRKLGSGRKRWMNGEANNASASPCTDGKHVWVFDGVGDFACFDFDGKEIWKFDAQDRYGKFKTQHGWHNSPLLDGDRLYIQLLHQLGAWVIALDKATGKEVWKIERKSDGYAENKDSYASPIMWRKGNDAYLIIHGNDYATAHSLKDGSEIWRVGDLNPNNAQHKYRPDLRFVASPVATPDLIVIPSAKQHDIVGLKPSAKGLVRAGSEYEQWRRSKGTPDVPSPLVYDGIVYLCGEQGLFTCLDAQTGKELYKPERLHTARYRASPVYGDGKIYCTARDGTITVIKAGPKYERLAEIKMPDQITASPAISNGRIYIRGWETLYAIGK
jgi:outer membrane protein assembly factor BamB